MTKDNPDPSLDDVHATLRQFEAAHGLPTRLFRDPADGSYCWICDNDFGGASVADLAKILDQISLWDDVLTNEQVNGRPLPFCGARHTNPPDRGGRPADPAVGRSRQTLIELVDSLRAATVRRVFYAASVRGLVDLMFLRVTELREAGR